MTKTFRDKWLEAVKEKNSVLCAGLDPAEFYMERGEKGLSKGASKLSWATNYIRAVAPYCAALKPNLQYWKGIKDTVPLHSLSATARDLGMVVIDDSKLADIGSTNDAGMFYSAQRADAVTFSPFAGNMGEAQKQAEARGLGLITMCLMSNPEYEREKNKLVPVEFATGYDEDADCIEIGGKLYVKQYMQLAHDTNTFGVAGMVIGAPSDKNHITEDEIKHARSYVNPSTMVLLPGVGAQGGEADAIWKHFAPENVIVNVGRALMLPDGSKSTPEAQAETAKKYQEMLNDLRAA